MEVKFFVGVALETILDDGEQTELKVYVHELHPFTEGDPSIDDKLDIKAMNVAPDATKVSAVLTSSYISCDYIGTLANLQRPNVHKGEQVGVFSVENDSKFFWFFLGRDYHVRKTEIVRMYVANKDNNTEPLTEANAYVAEIDTRDGQKKVLVKTNKNMGEPYAYELCIDTVAGTFHFKDDAGNEISLNSAANTWMLKNGASESIVLSPGLIKIDTVKMIINAPAGIDATASVFAHIGNVTGTANATFAGNVIDGGSNTNHHSHP